jgi:hypothetical protein
MAPLPVLLAVCFWLWSVSLPALALDQPLQVDNYVCEGDPLQAALYPGAVDAVGIPNTVAGTAPGAYVVLQWRNLRLQLPRTNNAGAPSFTDGRWWWSRWMRTSRSSGSGGAVVQTYSCTRSTSET